MPDAIATLADWEHDRVIRRVVGHRHRVVLIRGKPRVTRVESTANGAEVVVQDYVLAIDTASKLRRGNFYFCRFVSSDPSVRDRNSPKQRGFKAVWRSDRVHVACFVADLFRDARIVGDDESERTQGTTERREHCDCGRYAVLCGMSMTRSCGRNGRKAESVRPKRTPETFSIFLPVITTREPSGPLVGDIPRISGRPACTIKTAKTVEIRNPPKKVALTMRPSFIHTVPYARAYII